jgi:hypothetical protein
MVLGPRPANFTTAGEDWELLTTQRSRYGINQSRTPGDEAIDIEYRRHAPTPAESDYGGDYAC